jgi:hypothetical protein
MESLRNMKCWLLEVLWLILSALFSLALVFTFFNVAEGWTVIFQFSDTYFVSDILFFFMIIFSVIGSWTFVMRAASSRFKNLLQLLLLTLFIGLSIYYLSIMLPSEVAGGKIENGEGWFLYPPFSGMSLPEKVSVLGVMFLDGAWSVWLYFGLIISFVALCGRMLWLYKNRATKI